MGFTRRGSHSLLLKCPSSAAPLHDAKDGDAYPQADRRGRGRRGSDGGRRGVHRARLLVLVAHVPQRHIAAFCHWRCRPDDGNEDGAAASHYEKVAPRRPRQGKAAPLLAIFMKRCREIKFGVYNTKSSDAEKMYARR